MSDVHQNCLQLLKGIYLLHMKRRTVDFQTTVDKHAVIATTLFLLIKFNLGLASWCFSGPLSSILGTAFKCCLTNTHILLPRGSGVCSLKEFWNLEARKYHFLHSTSIKSALNIDAITTVTTQMQFMTESWRR